MACHLLYGGESRLVTARSSTTSYEEPPIAVGSYFQFRIVFQSAPAELAAVRLYTYADEEHGPRLLHLARFPYPAPPQPAAQFGFTGLQSVHEPMRDGELQYWCEMAGTGVRAVRTEPAPERVAASSRRDTGTVRLLFAGDVMLDEGPGRTVAAGGDPFAAFRAILRDADYAVGNLECPIAGGGEALARKIYAFRADPRVLSILASAFDAVSLANNHSGDYGKDAFLETLQNLRRVGIAAFGGGRDAREAHAPLWVERNGLRIALLGYNEFKPRSFEAGPTWPGIAWSEDGEVVGDIRAARRAGA